MIIPEKGKSIDAELNKEVLLHLNERLFQRGIISQEMYEQAKLKIVSKST